MIDKIDNLIKRYPFETGTIHPAEDLLSKELTEFGISNIENLINEYLINDDVYYLMTLLVLLSRLYKKFTFEIDSVIYTNVAVLISAGQESIEIRDTAYMILETLDNNASKAMLSLLYLHEKEKYLQQYIKGILNMK